jgi:hypothetical protein
MKIKKNIFQNLYFGNRRVDRVIGFLLSSRPNWDSPAPSPAGECVPPLLVRGGGETLAGGRGGVPNSDEGTDTVVLLVYMYFVLVAGQDTVCTNRLFSI